MDWGYKAQYFTLDVICELAWGRALGFLDEGRDVHDYIKIATSALPLMMIMGTYPGLAKMLQSRFLRRFLPKETDKIGFGAFIG
jgi:hypothetical protein